MLVFTCCVFSLEGCLRNVYVLVDGGLIGVCLFYVVNFSDCGLTELLFVTLI